MSAWTPGPWRVSESYPDKVESSSPPITVAYAFGGPYGDTAAVARLIAAAPELYECLRELVFVSGGLQSEAAGSAAWARLPQVILLAHAALEKAAGIEEEKT